MKKKTVKRVCMVMMTGMMLAGCGKSAEKPAEQEAAVEAQLEQAGSPSYFHASKLGLINTLLPEIPPVASI